MPTPTSGDQPKRFDVAGLLVPGRNVVAIEAANTAPGPAGLIVYGAVQLADGQQVVLTSGDQWKCNEKQQKNWEQVAFDDSKWQKAYLVAPYGSAPWGNFAGNLEALPAEKPKLGEGPSLTKRLVAASVSLPQQLLNEVTPPEDYPWPEGIVYLGDDCSLYRGQYPGTSHDTLSVTVFTTRSSRSYPEHDLPTPIKMGRKLYALKPARPGTQPRLLVDAGRGGIGSPSVSFDGQSIYMAMAKDDEPFFHIYRIPAAGGPPQRLTDGPFHDIDPAELPDGRIVFTSTRIGTYEEYHNPPSRALFTMNPDGTGIRPITNTFIFDNEAEVMADGRILFIRSDNFFDRGKVETLLHAVHPDGTEGYTEFGLDIGPDYGGRLRAFYCGSPAPMPDGQVAFVSGPGITVGRPGSRAQRHYQMPAGDVAALPDGRLLATVGHVATLEEVVGKQKRTRQAVVYEKIIVFDPQGRDEGAVVLYESPGSPLHSPVYLGARTRPPVIPPKVEQSKLDDPSATGVLFCQNARFTKNTTAGWQHVRAIRVLAGKGLTNRSSHAYIVHAGSEVTELGTVPLAPDGSFSVEVPADTAIAFQAVDGEGRSELNEMSWIFVRPGEQRGCVGCHQSRQATPLRTGQSLALSVRPLRLLGQGQPHRFRGNNPAVTGQMEMQFDRYREVAGINRHSLTVEPLATGKEEVAALVAQLQGDNGGLKISSAQRLSVFRAPEAAPALASLLDDDSREVRVAAAMALGACGTRESVPPLLAALTTGDPLTAQAAAVALENLTGHREEFNGFAAPAERAAQAEKWRAWFAATNWQSIEQDLVRRLQDPDRDVVRRAAVALGHIGQDAARDALRTYVARERENNPYPEWRKSHSGDGARFNSLSPANPRTLQAATRSLGYLQGRQGPADAGRNGRPPQRSGDGQPVPGRGGRGGDGADRHARGPGRAGPGPGRAEGLLLLRRLVRRPRGAVRLPCLAGALLHRRGPGPSGFGPRRQRRAAPDPVRAHGSRPGPAAVHRRLRGGRRPGDPASGRRGGRGGDLPGHPRRCGGRARGPRSSRPSPPPTPPGPASPIPRTAPRRCSPWSAAIAATSRESAPPWSAIGSCRWWTSTGKAPALCRTSCPPGTGSRSSSPGRSATWPIRGPWIPWWPRSSNARPRARWAIPIRPRPARCSCKRTSRRATEPRPPGPWARSAIAGPARSCWP